MRKIFLRWLFGTSDITKYMDLLSDYLRCNIGYSNELKEHKKSIEQHNQTINESLENLYMIKKLLKICENHEIDVDKELEQIEV